MELLSGITVEEQADSLAVRYAGKLFAALGASVSTLPRSAPADRYEQWLDRDKRATPSTDEPDVVFCADPAAPARGRVQVAVVPFGDGPYADHAFADVVVEALSGWLALGGTLDGPPLAHSLPLASLAAGANAAVAAAFLLADRKPRPGTRRAAVSVLDTMQRILGPWGAHYPYVGNILQRSPVNGFRTVGIVPCSDGYIATPMARYDYSLVGALFGEPRMEEPRWQDTSYMLEHVEELRSLVRGALASAKKDDIAPLAPAAGLPWAPVCDATEVAACPQLQARGFWRSHGGELDAGLPLQIAASKPAPPGRSPRKRTIPAVGTGPLAGLVVVELTVAWAGPFAGMLMAQAGATVIKVESARKPDTARSFPIMDDLLTENWWDRSLSFYVANNSKHFVGLELDRPGGIEIVERLAAEADVLINNHSPRVFDNLGMTFERLAEINPDLVYLESTGFGHNGPYRDRGALGWSLEAMSGVNAYHGYPGGEPMWSRMTFPDTFGALHGALGVAATLIANARRPAATWLDVSQYEAGVHGALPALLDDVAEGRAGHRLGNRHRVFAPQGVFACVGEEQWVALAVNDEAQWRALAGLTGMPAALVALDSHAARHAHHDAIDDAIARWTVRRGKVEAERALQAAGVPAGAVLDSREIFDGEHFARHGWVPAASRECGARAYPAPWQRFEDGATGVAWATSSFGEHNDLVLGEWLGLRDELPRLRKAGVVVDRPTYAVAPSTGGLLPERLLQLREIRAHDPEYRAAERALIARSMELNAPPR